MPQEFMPIDPFSRAVKGYRKRKTRSAKIFSMFTETDQQQQDAWDLEDALEEALLANEEQGLRSITVPVPESLNTAFEFGHEAHPGEYILKKFVFRVYHTLGIPRHYISHDAANRTMSVKIF